MFELFHDLCKNAQGLDRIVLSNGRSRASLADLQSQVEALRQVFAAKFGRSTVLLSLPGGPEFTAVILASLETQSVVAPVPSLLKGAEAEDYLRLIRPDIVVVESLVSAEALIKQLKGRTRILSLGDPSGKHLEHEILGWDAVMRGNHEAIDARESQLPIETAMVQFTSGSLDKPKGILISQANLIANHHENRAYLTSFSRGDVFCPIPQFQAMGGAVVLEHLLAGCAVHLSNQFVLGEDLARMNRYGCRAILSSPNYLRLLLRFGAFNKQHLPNLEVVVMGTASVDPGLIDEMQAHLPGVGIHIRYGLTESVGTATRQVLAPGERLKATGLVGGPVPGIEVATNLSAPSQGSPAEILVRASTVAIGEVCNLDEWKPIVDQSGFLRTGDLGYRDQDGSVHLRGRLSAFLKSNGHRISPFEIESVLRAHKDVEEVVVVGVPDPISGERVVACMEGALESRNPDPRELRAHCEDKLSPYKIPREFNWLETLPRTAAGKPDRRRILSLVSGTT